MTDKEALELSLAMLERDNLKVGNIYVNYDIQKALIKLVKKTLDEERKKKEWQGLMAEDLMNGIPDMPIKVQDDSESPPESWAQSAQVNGIDRWIKANTEHRQWYICPKCSYQAPRFKDEWQGLTKDEISNWDLPDSPTVYEFAQFVEAKLKEKNSG